MTRLGAVILAAGQSTRLGEHKPLARVGGRTLLEHAAELFRTVGAHTILAVAGHRAPETLGEARRLGIRAVVNEDYAGGMFTSAAAGLRELDTRREGLDAVFVLPVDIPLVRPQTLRLLLTRFALAPAAVLHPVFHKRLESGQVRLASGRGHPPLIKARHCAEVAAWTGPGGLSGALQDLEARHGAADVPCADRNIHFDVDTQADLAEARQRFERRGIPTPEEAEALLDLHQAGPRGLAHGRGVARAALRLAAALNARGAGLDLELVESAALLHDIAKGSPRHEATGAALLDSQGYGPVARIVAAHRDIPPEAVDGLTERELVYFADKLVRGSDLVDVPARFQDKLDLFQGDAEATSAIRSRLKNALAMQRRIETEAGGMGLARLLDKIAAE